MTEGQASFQYVSQEDPHRQRRARIRRRHPEIAALIGPNPYSFALIMVLVATQLRLAYLVRDQHWLLILVVAYLFGTFVVGALNSLIHEAAHNLIFRGKTLNRLAAIVANLALGLMAAETFRRYHHHHHSRLGDYRMDVGIPSHWEAAWVGHSAPRKAIWLALFGLFQLGRTRKYIRKRPFLDRWTALNLGLVVVVDALIVWQWGLASLLYLVLCLWLAFGFHPVGARVIQEHFIIEPGQETNNYSGAANLLECNFGCHVEHHDFPGVPWNRLPGLARIAPEFYASLKDHPSRIRLMWSFILDPDWNLYRHAVNPRSMPGLTD